MALRLPGKGNFKPVKKPMRKPGAKPTGLSQPSQGPSQSQPPTLTEQSTVALKSQPSQKPEANGDAVQELPPSLKPTTQELKTQPVPSSQPKPPTSQSKPPATHPKPPASQPKPPVPVSQPKPPVSQPKPIDDPPPTVAPIRESDTPAIAPESEGATSSTPGTPSSLGPSRTPRPPKPRFTPARQPAQKKTKALLVAAATSGQSDPSSPRPIHHRRRGGTASVASTTRGDDDTRMEDVESIPPAVVVADVPPAVVPVGDYPSSDLPLPSLDDLPPVVAGPSTVTQSTPAASDTTPDSATLAAALVATIQPEAGPAAPRRKRRPRKPIDLDAQPAPTKKHRPMTRRSTSRSAEEEVDELVDDEEGLPEPTGLEGIPSRSQRSKSASSRRGPHTPRQFTFSHPELDGVEEDGRVGDFEYNPAVAKLSDLATISEGRVSARTIKLHQFQRAEEERKQRERAKRTEANWRRLQVVRRKARKLKNIARAQRRLRAISRGDKPEDVVSDDSVDSEEEYEPIPDRLTPPGSPRVAERVAPINFDGVAEAGGADEEEIVTGHIGEEEDIEGLGLSGPVLDEEEEVGEELEDFQLPVEAGEEGDEFSGLVANEYGGGQLDDEGNWIENTESAGMVLQRRNEENRRRILEGNDDRQVEVIDNETQFINYSTWGKKVSNERWTAEETELFFDVLRETGENYTLMKAYFPGRNVKQLKKKGHRENKNNPTRMTECILNRKSMDKEYLAKSSGFKVTATYEREVEFLGEVAAEKDRIVSLGPLVEGEGEDEQRGLDPLEFGGQL